MPLTESTTLSPPIAPGLQSRNRGQGIAASVATIPWPLWTVILGASSITVGILWDISWHETIGRDTFWTPAHMAIYLGGLLAGGAGGYLIARATLSKLTDPATTTATTANGFGSIRVLGMRGPVGAWICVWGCLAMTTSAPFDDWWHNAYGLDVEILSPPHTVLAAGMYTLVLGGMILALAWQNQNPQTDRRLLQPLLIYAGGILVTLTSIIYTEFSRPNQQHQAFFYQLCSAAYLAPLVFLGLAIRHRWAATGVAAVYMLAYCLMIWILPLFEAQPMLAPIYHPVDSMVPPPFPLLLVVPAIAIDLCLRVSSLHASEWRRWIGAALLAVAFLTTFLPAQWYFAEFLLSPAADNWLFAGDRYWAFFESVGDWRDRFWGASRDPLTLAALAKALGLGLVSARIGLSIGSWLQKVRR